jgi:hypothetical protein
MRAGGRARRRGSPGKAAPSATPTAPEPQTQCAQQSAEHGWGRQGGAGGLTCRRCWQAGSRGGAHHTTARRCCAADAAWPGAAAVGMWWAARQRGSQQASQPAGGSGHLVGEACGAQQAARGGAACQHHQKVHGHLPRQPDLRGGQGRAAQGRQARQCSRWVFGWVAAGVAALPAVPPAVLPAVLPACCTAVWGTEKAMQLQRCAEGERARGVGQTGLTFCAAWRTWSEKRSSVAAWSASGSATPVLIMNP